MLLRDLYRYRPSGSKESRETWLTACLGELLSVDNDFRAQVLSRLGVELRAPHFVEHQRRFGSLGDSQVADLYIEGEGGDLIIECKDRAAPDLAQMRGYQRRAPRSVIVLVAGAAAIATSASGKEWETIPRLSWQALYEIALPDAKHPLYDWLRAGFRELLEWAGYAPVGDVRPADVREMIGHWQTLAARQAELREGVHLLQPRDVAISDERWAVDGLSAWWSVERASSGLDVRGLRLNAEISPRGALVWSLDLRPTGAAPSRQALADYGFVDLEDEKWWRLHLFAGQAGGVWEQELAHAVAQGRASLAALGVRRGRSALDESGATSVASLVRPGGTAARTNAAIWASRRAIRETLAQRVLGKAGRDYTTVLDGDTKVGWFWVHTETPGFISLRLGWWPARNRERFPIVRQWWARVADEYGGVNLKQDEYDSASFEIDLREVPLRAACDGLVGIGARLFEQRKAELFSP